MKDASKVGSDFDKYAARWKASAFGLEVGGDAAGIKTVPSAEVQKAGDEWGAQQTLLNIYAPLFERYLPGSGTVNFLEIGPGGGRSSECVIRLLGERLSDYQAIDVSQEFVKVARERVGEKVTFNIIDRVDFSMLPEGHFDLCLAQSSWSHINLYDQYLYLRELRRVLKKGAPVAVIGQFVVGFGDDWTWNRFLNRIAKKESRRDGIFHEVIGASMLAEFLVRLGYSIDIIFRNGFVARSGGADADRLSLSEPIAYPFAATLHGLFEGALETVEIPASHK